MQTYIILIRGVTPTGKNRVPMVELRTALHAAGLHNVNTYIQSGNVLAQSELEPAALEQLVHDVIADQFGGDLTILARTPEEHDAALAGNPFGVEETKRLYFTQLASEPEPERLQEFLALDFAPDQVRVAGKVIYTLYADKYSSSKINNNFFERKLKVRATTRNFNTMTRLADMAKA